MNRAETFATIWNAFDVSEHHETITSRIITVSTEIILLQCIFKDYIDKDEYDANIKSLNDDLDTVKELRA